MRRHNSKKFYDSVLPDLQVNREELAKATGVTPAKWYKIENEETKVLPLKTLQKIEGVLRVNLGVNLND